MVKFNVVKATAGKAAVALVPVRRVRGKTQPMPANKCGLRRISHPWMEAFVNVCAYGYTYAARDTRGVDL